MRLNYSTIKDHYRTGRTDKAGVYHGCKTELKIYKSQLRAVARIRRLESQGIHISDSMIRATGMSIASVEKAKADKAKSQGRKKFTMVGPDGKAMKP